MSRNAFVVRSRFVVNERTLGEIGSGDNHTAGALAIGRPGNVVGCRSCLERRDGFDRHRRFRQQGEKLRKFGLHLGDVMAEIVEDLL